MNLVVALLAGVISITGGVYSLKNNLFSGPAYGSVQGTVRDAKIARPLKLAAVEITDLAGAVVNTAETDDDGHYLIEAINTGNYVVKFTAPMHKVETKTIKIEKDLASSISVDLVPEMEQAQTAALESPAAQTITPPYTPVANYQTSAPAAPSYNGTGVISPGTSVPSAYPQSEPVTDPSVDPRYSSYRRRRPPHRYPGEYDQTSSASAGSTDSQGSAIATVGTQLLQALMAKKSEDSTTTTASN
jgi:hypothetical protein